MTTRPAPTVSHVQLDELHANPDNPRDTLGDLDELAASIVAVGLLQPLLVVPVADAVVDGFMVVDGHRRHAAMCQVDYSEPIPVVVTELDAVGRLAAAVSAGVSARPLSPVEEAKGYRRLRELGLTLEQIAARTGVGAPRISTRLKLLLLTPAQQLAVHEGRMTLNAAKEAGYLLGRRAPDKAPRPSRRTVPPAPSGQIVSCPTCGSAMHTTAQQGQRVLMLVCGDCRMQFLPTRAEWLNKHCLSAHGRRATAGERTPVPLTPGEVR